jgi:hypothetical protein
VSPHEHLSISALQLSTTPDRRKLVYGRRGIGCLTHWRIWLCHMDDGRPLVLSPSTYKADASHPHRARFPRHPTPAASIGCGYTFTVILWRDAEEQQNSAASLPPASKAVLQHAMLLPRPGCHPHLLETDLHSIHLCLQNPQNSGGAASKHIASLPHRERSKHPNDL